MNRGFCDLFNIGCPSACAAEMSPLYNDIPPLAVEVPRIEFDSAMRRLSGIGVPVVKHYVDADIVFKRDGNLMIGSYHYLGNKYFVYPPPNKEAS